MSLISCIINVDSRPQNNMNGGLSNGVVNDDFLTEGVINKINFFKGLDTEFIVLLDEHITVKDEIISEMRELCDTLIIKKHREDFELNKKFPRFNDINYLQALFMATGKYIFHFDADVAAFTTGTEPIEEYIKMLDVYDYVSYPSLFSPYPAHDDSWNGEFWASTRFFCCKRKTINFSEAYKCLIDYDYWSIKYPMNKKCHWTEHILASMAWNGGNGVFYPPVQFHKIIIYTWANYDRYVYKMLNHFSFERVKEWVDTKHFAYPNDLTI